MTTPSNDSSAPASITPVTPVTRILVAVDASPASTAALRYLGQLLRSALGPASRPDAAVRIVSVAENPRSLVPLGTWAAEQLDAARDEIHRDAEKAAQLALDALHGCGLRIDAEVVDLCKEGGDVVDAIAAAASRWPADLVVLGTSHHRGLMRWVEGEVAAPFARLLRWPVLLVPAGYEAPEDEAASRILFATDGSDASFTALRTATALATPDAHWCAIYVVDRLLAPGTGFFERKLEEALSEAGGVAVAKARADLAACGQEGWNVETAIVKTANSFDDVPHTLDREAKRWNAQLLVLGTHGRRGLTRWLLGSVAERATRLASVPLLLVPPAME
ncbi:universal stress protein [Paraburkholderia sp. A2WS-5]|uniref:universal stress protein n=1 Tax=unclassified Paraburkholderia TaxID=2615204 RepID=UPI003B7ECEC9